MKIKNCKITASVWNLSYEGDAVDALDLVRQLHYAFAVSGTDMPKMLNDFVFNIEVALQNSGVLDDNFDVIED